MKKVISFIICGVLALSFVGCGSKDKAQETNNKTKQVVSEDTQADKNKEKTKTEDKKTEIGQTKTEGGQTNTVVKKASLFFSDDQGMYLNKEEIEVKEVTPEILIQKLTEGPKDKKHSEVIPKNTKITVEVKNGVAYVNFDKEIKEELNGGSAAETMIINSIVDTLVLNQELKIKSVQFLIDGNKEDTINGHEDISNPLTPNMSMVK